ncbi:MAG: HrpE/YscL family type III secretion apparatus protein [Candidatus Adiutrix sp.]|jgi:type III secretion protein L|nr:HrpE/YscL family type III secretion apparatus protein [Candidatus Adiutrix sp.]
MATLFQLLNGRPRPKPGQLLVKAEEAGLFFEAGRLAEAVRREAQEAARAAEETYRRRYEEGYQAGREAGQMEYADKIMEAVLSSVEYLETLEVELVRLVGEVTRKLIGELDDRERIVRLVRQALASVRGQKRVLIRVAARDEAAVRADLAGLLSRTESGDFLDVRADPDLAPGSCFLETDLGVVEASLETQLKNLEKALLRRIR